MLYPIANEHRTIFDLCGFWQFKEDESSAGVDQKWFNGLPDSTDIAVPGSWNEQLEELGLMNYVGKAWYEKTFTAPAELAQKRFWLRFGSVDQHAKVWLNGEYLGRHKGGFLPFEFEVTDRIKLGKPNRLSVLVDSQLYADDLPQGTSVQEFQELGLMQMQSYPPVRFDFFPYGGIHRPVVLYTTGKDRINKVFVQTKIMGDTGLLNIKIYHANHEAQTCQVEISQPHITAQKSSTGEIDFDLQIPKCKFWTPETPYLYDLRIRLTDQDRVVDEYTLPIGIREIAVKEDKILLNGKSIYLKGFGKHEDYATIGKGTFPALLVKDFNLMKWTHANAFRTSHYPYSEETMYFADKQGFLVINEVPAVNTYFKDMPPGLMENHKAQLQKLIERDYNHPSVIMWSIANEPGYWKEAEAQSETAKTYFKTLGSFVKRLDATRPVTCATFDHFGVKDVALSGLDVIAINRYYGWYENPADLDEAKRRLSAELDELHEKYRRPIIVTEFGADAIEGMHATSLQLFTEEYQVELLKVFTQVIRSKPFCAGELVWNFADFKTSQHHRRVIVNRKGVFTRERKPKMAAYFLKELWGTREPS